MAILAVLIAVALAFLYAIPHQPAETMQWEVYGGDRDAIQSPSINPPAEVSTVNSGGVVVENYPATASASAQEQADGSGELGMSVSIKESGQHGANTLLFSSSTGSMEVGLERKDRSGSAVINSTPSIAQSGGRFKFGYEGVNVNRGTEAMVFRVSSGSDFVMLSPQIIGIAKSSNGFTTSYDVLDFSDLLGNNMSLDFVPSAGGVDVLASFDTGLVPEGGGSIDLDPEFYTASTVNITGYSDCISFIINATALGYGANCTSPFSGANCTSVNATINITQTGNLTLENCEIRLNQTANGQNVITSYGNLTLNRVNITVNQSSLKSALIIGTNSNFSSVNSSFSDLGWAEAVNQRGIEFNSPVFTFLNNTVRNAGIGITLYSGANGSMISNNTLYNMSGASTFSGIKLITSSNNTVSNNNVSYSALISSVADGIRLSSSYNNTISNNIVFRVGYGIYPSSRCGNNVISGNNITLNSGSAYGIYETSGSNETIADNNVTTLGSSSYAIYLASTNSSNVSGNNILTTGSTSHGIYLSMSSNSTMAANFILASGSVPSGILFETSSNNNTLRANNVTSTTGSGIYIHDSQNETLVANNVSTPIGASYLLEGSTMWHFNHTMGTDNLADGMPVNFSFNCSGTNISYQDMTRYGETIFAWCRNVTVYNSTFGNDSMHLAFTNTSTIANNYINTSNGNGVLLYSFSNANNLSNNTIVMSAGASTEQKFGIRTYDSSQYNTINNNTITSYNANSFCLRFNSGYNIANGNMLYGIGVGTTGIGVYSSASYNSFANDTIWVPLSASYGILFVSGTTGNSFTGMYVNTSGSLSHAVLLYPSIGSYNFTMADSILNASGTRSDDFNVSNLVIAGSVWNFTNVTRSDGVTPARVNRTGGNAANGTLNVFWYVTANATSSNQPLPGVNASAFDVLGVLQNSTTSGTSGIAKLALQEYAWGDTMPAEAGLPGGGSASSWINMSGNVLLMHLDNSSTLAENNTLMYDSSGTGNNGSCPSGRCPNFTSSGHLGGAQGFNTMGQYISSSDSTSLEITGNEITINAWVYPAGLNTSSWNYIAIKTSNSNKGYYFGSDYGNLEFSQGLDSDNSSIELFVSSTFTKGAWQMVTAMKNSSGIYIYKNGVVLGNKTCSFPLVATTDQLYMGGSSSARTWNGSIDEVAIWNRSLTDTEILNIYNNQSRFYFSNYTVYGNLSGYTNYTNSTINLTSNIILNMSMDSTAPPAITIDNSSVALRFGLGASIQGTCSGANLARAWTNSRHFTGEDASPSVFNFSNTTALPNSPIDVYVMCNNTAGNSNFSRIALSFSPAFGTAQYDYASSGINITGYANCTSIAQDINNASVVSPCSSAFASTCISVAAGINVTDRRTGGNLSLDGCELRMNQTSDGSSTLISWGNLSIYNSNITTNDSNYESALIAKPGSNFSMRNSFASEMGWNDASGQRGIELESPVLSFNNNTISNCRDGIRLNSGSDGSMLSNATVSSSTNDIYIASNNNTLSNITAGSGSYGFYLSSASNNTLMGVSASYNGFGIYMSSGSGNNFSNITASYSTYVDGIWMVGSSGNSFSGITASSNSRNGIWLSYGSSNNTFSGVTANSNYQNGITIDTSSYSNAFSGIGIWNCSWLSASYACISVDSSINNTFSTGMANFTKSILARVTDSNGTVFRDMAFSNMTSIAGGMNISSSGAGSKSMNNVFLNCSFYNTSEAVGSNSQLSRQWYLDVHANYTNASAASGANISVWNSTGSLINYTSANSTGWGYRLNITQYYNTSGTASYAGNYTVYANRSGFTNASASWAIGNGTSGTYTTADGWSAGDWAQNNTRLSLSLHNETGPPSISLLSPNASHYNTTSLYIIFSNLSSSSVWYNYTSGNVTAYSNGPLAGAEGSNNITLWANNTMGYSHTMPFTVNIDTQPPNVALENLTSSFERPYSITINGTCTDHGIAGLHYAYTNSSYFASVDSSPSTFNLTNTTALPGGEYTVYVFCNDTYGNNINFARFQFVAYEWNLVSSHTIQIAVEIQGTSGKVSLGSGTESAASSLSNSTSYSPGHFFVSSSESGSFRGLVPVSGAVSIGFGRSGSSHSLLLNQTLDSASNLLAFSKGDAPTIVNRIASIEDGSFFGQISPSFGSGIDTDYPVKVVASYGANYSNVNITGSFALGPGQHSIIVERLGSSGGRRVVGVRQA